MRLSTHLMMYSVVLFHYSSLFNVRVLPEPFPPSLSPYGYTSYCLTRDDKAPKWYIILVLIGFVATIAWLDLVGNECVAVLEVLGEITGIGATPSGSAILGITLLAWANSIGDFVADTAVARAGRPKMGVASVFGSPLLTACLGLGLASVIACASNANHRVKAHMSDEIVISYVFLFISYVCTHAH